MAQVEGNTTSEECAVLTFRRPVHSESLAFNGVRYSLIIVNDDNPRLEWTREGERGTRKSVIWGCQCHFSKICGSQR